jgi:hypothetical protein
MIELSGQQIGQSHLKKYFKNAPNTPQYCKIDESWMLYTPANNSGSVSYLSASEKSLF